MDIDYTDTKTSEQTEFECECIKCGNKIKTEEHCIDLKCPECGGQMRRTERPGVGQENNSPDNNGIKPQEETTMEEKKESVEEIKEEVKEEVKKEVEENKDDGWKEIEAKDKTETETETKTEKPQEEKTEEDPCKHVEIIEAKDKQIQELTEKLESYEKTERESLIKEITKIAGKTEDYKDMTLSELKIHKETVENVKAKINARKVNGIGESSEKTEKKLILGGKWNDKGEHVSH